MLGQFSSTMSQRMAMRAGFARPPLAKASVGTDCNSGIKLINGAALVVRLILLCEWSGVSAPTARNVIAWAIGPGERRKTSPALKARNGGSASNIVFVDNPHFAPSALPEFH